MTANRQLDATWMYHNGTKHSYQSVRTGPHGLDWDNQPIPYKIYSTLEPSPLPHDLLLPDTPALTAIAATGAESAGTEDRRAPPRPDLRTLAGLFFLSAGVTKRVKLPGGTTMDFRAAACTGALYHIELYLVCGRLSGLEAGVYHFGVHDFALRLLRTGDYRDVLVAASGAETPVANAPAVLILTTTFWRNAWKYRARAYRHAFWDSGTILANLLAAAAGFGLPARIVCGFVDAAINHLLDLDTQHEVSLALVSLGKDGGDSAAPPIESLGYPTVPLSKTEVDYPAIRAMHEASSLASEEEVHAWRDGHPPYEAAEGAPSTAAPPAGPSKEDLLPLQPLEDANPSADTIATLIARRGSARRFTREPIAFEHLSTLLDGATSGVPADFLTGQSTTLNDLYLIVNAVDGLTPGAYVYQRDAKALQPLREGEFRRQAGHLALDQALGADASVCAYFMANLPPILGRFGNRGYRVAQLEAAITGGKLYLAAYALRLGATGLTFYDDDVTEFFSPHAGGKSVMFLTALGRPARRSRRNV